MIYQVTELYVPRGLSGHSVRGVADFRRKADAIKACEDHPTRAVVGIANTSEIIFDNAKPVRLEN